MKICVFCGKSSEQVQITKEHILPKWMKKAFPHAKRYLYSSDYAGKNSVKREVKGQTSFDMVISRVCQHCNNGWMSQQLEAPLKDTLSKMILGEQIRIDVNKINLLCVWAFKTAIVRALIDNGRTFIPQEYYAKAAKLQIPNGCSIYLADRGCQNDFYYTRHTTLGPENKPGFICALEIRSLVLFVLCSEFQETRAFLNDECERINNTRYIKKIWPPLPSSVIASPIPRSITWPLDNKLPFPSTHFADVVLSNIYTNHYNKTQK